MTRKIFFERLVALDRRVIDMGTLVENNLLDAINALYENDKEKALLVIESDKKVDEMELELQSECISLLGTQQPVAGDLRLVTSILKMVTDLERIGDQATDIADISVIIDGQGIFSAAFKEEAMTTYEMVRDSINAFISKDALGAEKVALRDDVVDALFVDVIADLETMIRNQPDKIDAYIKLIMAAKYLERIADHATNIAEWVIYSTTGKHNKLN